MEARVIIAGQYELAETASGDRLLSLDAVRCFCWADGADGDWLTRWPTTDAVDVVRPPSGGEFLLVAYVRGPRVGDALHLFLSDGPLFDEYLLPRGLPSRGPESRRITATGERLERSEVLRYVTDPPARPGGAPIASES